MSLAIIPVGESAAPEADWLSVEVEFTGRDAEHVRKAAGARPLDRAVCSLALAGCSAPFLGGPWRMLGLVVAILIGFIFGLAAHHVAHAWRALTT